MTDTIAEIRARHEACGHIEQWPDFDSFEAHADRATLLRLLDAAREELRAEQVSHLKTRVRLTRIREAASDPVLIDGDGRTTVRIFTPYDPPSPGAITGIRKAKTPCSDCIDGWCQLNCGPRVG
jgi:hypothetical protein